MDASNKYNSYEQLDFAAMSCRNDSECVGIYDEGCDSNGPFLHIRKGFMRPSHGRNCLHKKKRYEGKQTFPPCSTITLPFQMICIFLLELCNYSLTGNELICFDVYMSGRFTPDYTWSLGHCSPSQTWLRPGTYIERCCLSKGVHVLTCKTGRTKNDWSYNVVLIMGHRFCEDYVGYEAVISINISGEFINGKIWIHDTYYRNILVIHIVN